MKNWRERFARFMVGRYGSDELNRFLVYLTMALVVLGLLLRSGVLIVPELICVALVYFRMFSKNINRRFQENQNYLNRRFRLSEGWRKGKFRFQEFRNYKIFKCPNCGQKLRIPRGKGNISIRCRKCGHEFPGKS